MDKVIVRSVYDAFEYVMDHYYPNGQEEYTPRKDTYAVISIQDTHTDGFGFVFTKTRYCKDVLTLYFDDIFKEVRGAVLFSEEQAEEIISFIWKSRNANTLLVHCYGGVSRSAAVGAFAVKMLGGDNTEYFQKLNPNRHIYDTLEEVWLRMTEAQ